MASSGPDVAVRELSQVATVVCEDVTSSDDLTRAAIAITRNIAVVQPAYSIAAPVEDPIHLTPLASTAILTSQTFQVESRTKAPR